VRIDWRVVDADLIVEIGAAGGSAADANVSDNLPADDGLAGHDCEAGEVRVTGLETMAVVEDYLATVTVCYLG
jgi:hypothetical protein